jgi:hypothetical protein
MSSLWRAAIRDRFSATGALLLAFTFAMAQAAPRAPVTKPAPPNTPQKQLVEVSIPYPNAGIYLYRGIYGSFAGGLSREADTTSGKEWQDALFQWQGEVGYFYTSFFSGGIGFRINAGAPSDSQQIVKNRYFLLARVHKAWPKAAAYAGLNLGVDDVNFSLNSSDTGTFAEPFQETNAGLGFEVGGGWKFSPYVAATLGQRMDISLVRQSADNPYRALNFVTQPGLTLDLLRVHSVLGTNVKALYLLTECQFGQSLTEQGTWRDQFAWVMGLSVAF